MKLYAEVMKNSNNNEGIKKHSFRYIFDTALLKSTLTVTKFCNLKLLMFVLFKGRNFHCVMILYRIQDNTFAKQWSKEKNSRIHFNS